MTIHDINDIIKAVCPNDEDYEKPIISPKYLRQELEQLALDQEQKMLEPTTKNNLAVDLISRRSRPVIHANWLSGDCKGAHCSNCEEYTPFVYGAYNYCPNCGADMRGEK